MVIYGHGGGHTRTHARTHAYRLRGQKQYQETRRAPAKGRRTPGLKIYCILIDIHLIAAVKAEENYDNLSTGFKDVFADINNLIANPVISILEEDYNVVFYLCSDYKVKFQLWLQL